MYPNPGQQPYTPYPIPQLPPMAQKKGFLAKLFKNTINRAIYANGSTLPTNGRATNDASATTTAAIPATISAATSTISTIHAATS